MISVETLLQVLSDAGKCLTAAELVTKLHQKMGGGESYTPGLIESILSKCPDVYKSGNKYCLNNKAREHMTLQDEIVLVVKQLDELRTALDDYKARLHEQGITDATKEDLAIRVRTINKFISQQLLLLQHLSKRKA